MRIDGHVPYDVTEHGDVEHLNALWDELVKYSDRRARAAKEAAKSR